MMKTLSLLLLLGLPMVSLGFRPITTPLRSSTTRRKNHPERVLGQQQHHHRSLFPLHSISEWRDLWFDIPTTTTTTTGGVVDETTTTSLNDPPLKEICMLPFPYSDVLVQGETKQLRLYEDRFIQLFDDCMENYGGVVAMGLIAESGIIETVSICEIEAYNRMEGFGIFVTIRVVSRGQLLDITQSSPYIKATCHEVVDIIPSSFELPSLVASNIENFMLLLSSMEHRLEQVKKDGGTNSGSSSSSSSNGLEDDTEDAERRRRIQIAKLENRFYDTREEDDDDDGDEEDDDEIIELDRRGRYRQAYHVAFDTDTQGYCVNTELSTTTTTATTPEQGGGGSGMERTPQELTAVSWASFCTNILPEEDATFRIQALACNNLFDRLKLASHMLREKKTQLKQQMDKAGIQFRGGEEEFDEDL